ncbi:MAG: hypothetical protein JWN70_98 [Planctomycetaceae bacterium]|nr:hypothetical protein [Planctomycetaceae bacterium]
MKQSISCRISSVVVMITMAMVSSAQAQEPTVVLSIRGLDAVLDDADFVGEELGVPGGKTQIENLVNGATGGDGLVGIDRKKPLGVYWTASSGETQEMPVAFIPVSDAEALKRLIEELTEDFKDEKGLWTASAGGNKLQGKLSGGYLFISPKLPTKLADPAKIATQKYDVSLDVSLASVPAPFKQLFLDQVDEKGRQSQENSPDPANDAERIGREWGYNGTLAILKSIVNDGDKLTLGVEVDRKGRSAAIDLSLTGKSKTPLANVLNAYGKIQPVFGALGSESSPFRMVFSLPTIATPEQVNEFIKTATTTINASIDQDKSLKSDEDRERVKELMGRVLTITQATLNTGSVHAGAVLEQGSKDTARFIGGAKVTNGDEVAKLLDDVIEWSKDEVDAPKVRLDVAKHAGARIHAVTVDENEAQKLFGDDPGHLAFRNDSFWLALGGDNLQTLKKSLDAKPLTRTTVAPISMKVKLAALLLLMKDQDPDEIEPLKKIAGTPGDKLNLEIVPVPSGAKLRIEFGIDLLKVAAELGDKDKEKESK